jgi:hypothetical protein
MPSRAVYEHLKTEGLDLTGGDSYRYNMYDSLASYEDLTELFGALTSYTDKNNNPAVFTVICIVANPDFKRIRENNFKDYFYEPFCETLQRYYFNEEVFELWKAGIREKIFIPQFHGREHLNVAEWMRALQEGQREALIGFDHEFWGFNNKQINGTNTVFQAAFDLYEPTDLKVQTRAVTEGLELFNKLFGYKATFFVPPNGPFNNSLEKAAADCGIKYISTSKIQIEPQGFGRNKRIFHYLGQRNKHNQRYLVRNSFFEPSMLGKDWVNSCLNDIKIAFRWHKPAIISTHRVNYIGVHDKKNRNNGLRELRLLLEGILKTWPEVEFITSSQLGDIITDTNNVS